MEQGNPGKMAVIGESAENLEKFRKPLLEYLTSNLEHKDKWVRYLAVDMLGALGDDGATRDLLPFIVCEDQDLRAMALRSIEKMGKFRMESSENGMAACSNCLIRSIAEEALSELRNRASCTVSTQGGK